MRKCPESVELALKGLLRFVGIEYPNPILRRKIDSRIEPIPFRPEDFYDGGMLIEEIKRTGMRLNLS